MRRRKIIFRADGNKNIGLGHVIRSLALANMLKEDFDCYFATCYINEHLKSEILQSCIDYIVLRKGDHFNSFVDSLQGNEIIVLDNYFFTTDYQQRIKDKGCPLVCIDDLHTQHYVADVVINHALGIKVRDYSIENYTRPLLGYDYALLRNEFINTTYKSIKKEYSLLMMMGGADPYQLTPSIVNHLRVIEWELPIAVIYNGEELNNCSNIKQFKNISALEVAQLMHQSKIGLFPSSTVAIEACACRLPFITGYFIENQQKIYSSLVENELAIGIGSFTTENLTIKDAIIGLYKNIAHQKQLINNQEKALDKKAKNRFLKIFHEL